MKAIVVDDEQFARNAVKGIIRDSEILNGMITVVAETDSTLEALELINQKEPNIIFLDIFMPGLKGYEIPEKVSHLNFIQGIVFITQHYEDFHEITRRYSDLVLPCTIITKPVNRLLLEDVCLKIHRRWLTSISGGDRKALEEENKPKVSLDNEKVKTYKLLDSIGFEREVPLREIFMLRKNDQKIIFDLSDGRSIEPSSRLALSGFLAEFSGEDFVQVNRATIINLNYVEGLSKSQNALLLLVSGKEIKVEITDSYRSALILKLEQRKKR
ncbi:MAG: response regulator transcription factor [Bacteroidia bacterium]|nr:response regulator transcription factor [Bacteroidia bacterium]